MNLDIETCGNCNRRCPTCIRNSHPDREKLSSWFEDTKLPSGLIYQSIEEWLEIKEDGQLCLSHYNEPLMDDRIIQIVKNIKIEYPQVFSYFHTNGDYLTEEIADELNGNLSRIVVTLYMDEPKKSERAEWVHTLFSKTICDVIIESAHIPTHFSPAYDIKTLAEKHKNHPCSEPSMRIVINHKGDYLLCCDDVIGNFDLGSYPEKSLKEHWQEKKKIQGRLSQKGGRSWHPYCESCPRP